MFGDQANAIHFGFSDWGRTRSALHRLKVEYVAFLFLLTLCPSFRLLSYLSLSLFRDLKSSLSPPSTAKLQIVPWNVSSDNRSGSLYEGPFQMPNLQYLIQSLPIVAFSHLSFLPPSCQQHSVQTPALSPLFFSSSLSSPPPFPGHAKKSGSDTTERKKSVGKPKMHSASSILPRSKLRKHSGFQFQNLMQQNSDQEILW